MEKLQLLIGIGQIIAVAIIPIIVMGIRDKISRSEN